MTITDAQRAELRKALAHDAIATRKATEGGADLSYLHGHYVMREMNRIFGNGAWGYRATVSKEWEGVNEKGNFVCTYLGRCVLTVGGDCVIEDVGAGQGNSKRPGEAIEKAAKEAATDALKRCCKTLGDPLGLALYDKEQRHVAEAVEEPAVGTVGDDVRIVIEMLTHDPAEAKKQIRASWSKYNAAERAAINAALPKKVA